MMLVAKNVSMTVKALSGIGGFLHILKRGTYSVLNGTANFGIFSFKTGAVWFAYSQWGSLSVAPYVFFANCLFFCEWSEKKTANYWIPLMGTALGVGGNSLLMNYFNDGRYEFSLSGFPWLVSAATTFVAIVKAEPRHPWINPHE
jgi:hypothetical protein